MLSSSNTFAVQVAAPAPAPTDLSITTSPAGQTLPTPQGTWSFGTATDTGGNALMLNGVQQGGGFGVQILFKAGVIYTFTKNSRWFRFANGSWAALSAAP
jgi:hypothetical protein